MEDSRVEVGMGEGLIAGSPAVVSSEGIGSCVVLILYDSGRRIGGVAHIMLPIVNRNPDHERRRFGPDAGSAPGYEKRQSERAFSPYQYADSALCALLDGMAEMGSDRSDISARIVGGGRMFLYYEGEADSIGTRNIDSIRRLLQRERIPLVGSDTGGSCGRSVEFSLDTGRVLVKATGREIKVI